jgi:hypothetical protein
MLERPERSGNACDPIALVGGGNLLYRAQDETPRTISLIGRQGIPERAVAALPFVVAPEISPDGSRAVMRGVQGGETWLVTLDLRTGEDRQLTSRTAWNSWPIWDATGRRVLFSSNLVGPLEVRAMDPDDTTSNRVLWTSRVFNAPDASTPDGRSVLVTIEGRGHADLDVRDFDDPTQSRAFMSTGANKGCGVFINGARQIAYVSDESGRDEIYAADFPNGTHRTRLTHDGCGYSIFIRHSVWHSGSELFYLSRDLKVLRAIRIAPSPQGIRAISDEPLFTLPSGCRGVCPTPDGLHFLLLVSGNGAAASALDLVQNWRMGLARDH